MKSVLIGIIATTGLFAYFAWLIRELANAPGGQEDEDEDE